MRVERLMIAGVTSIVVGTIAFAQVGRGGSQWLTALGDAQRTSWVRTDDKISVPALSKPGFELQWKSQLGNRPRGFHGLGQGVTASGVTLFVPMSIVTGSSNTCMASTTTSATSSGNGGSTRRFRSRVPTVPAVSPRARRVSSGWTEQSRQTQASRVAVRWAIAACSASQEKACRSKGESAVRGARGRRRLPPLLAEQAVQVVERHRPLRLPYPNHLVGAGSHRIGFRDRHGSMKARVVRSVSCSVPPAWVT